MVPSVYTMEAVRDFQAMDSDCNSIRQGEALTLILDNQKFCLVHRRDDLPFVVPNSYVSLQTPTEEKRPGSFSKFLRERKTIRNRQKYPMSTFNLESIVPQFATVTDSFTATSFNEVDLMKDTAVLILNADPQSLYLFGVTQYGAYGLLPRNNVSMVTQRRTPSLQQGCRLTAHTRKAYLSGHPHELSVRKGWNLEVIGMPELWRWQVRLTQGERKVGLLPVHILSEVSVITCPDDGAAPEITAPLLDTATPVRPPSILNPLDMDPTNLALVVRTGEETIKKRQSRKDRPLPEKPAPISQSLNDLNRLTGRSAEPAASHYMNTPPNHFSICSSPDTSLAQELVSDEEAVARRLAGVSALGEVRDSVEDEYYDMPSPTMAAGERVDALSEIERMFKILRREHESLKREREENQWEACQWKRTADDIFRIMTRAVSKATLSKSQMDLRKLQHGYYYTDDMGPGSIDRSMKAGLRSSDEAEWRVPPFREELPEWDMDGDRLATMPKRKPTARVRRSSLAHPSPASQIREEKPEVLGAAAPLTRSSSQPLLDVGDANECEQMADLVFMSPRLSGEIIHAVVDIVCPVTVRRPQLHWKPLLVALGLGEETARLITNSGRSCRDQWKEALLAWRDEMGDEALTKIFLEQVMASGHHDLYEKIVTKCTFWVHGTATYV